MDAGVSSSSALVVAAALASSRWRRLPRPHRAGRDTGSWQQYVGTLSGGMDQAAILLAQPEQAVRLDFFPLQARTVAIPGASVLHLAHSLERAAKAGAARGHYNQRVVECRAACALLAHRLARPVERLGDLPDPAGVLRALDDLLPEGPVSRAELTARFGLEAAEVERLVPPQAVVSDADRLVLRARVRHVLTEAARVDAAEQALLAGDLVALGALLDASHASGAADYATTHPAADELVRLARAAGALGARLMGAGFGGRSSSSRSASAPPRSSRRSTALLPTAPRRSRQPLHGRTGEWRDHRARRLPWSRVLGQSRFGEVREPG